MSWRIHAVAVLGAVVLTCVPPPVQRAKPPAAAAQSGCPGTPRGVPRPSRPRQVIQRGHTQEIMALAVSESGLLATAGDGVIRIWSLRERALVSEFAGGRRPVRGLTWVAGDRLAVKPLGKDAYLVDVRGQLAPAPKRGRWLEFRTVAGGWKNESTASNHRKMTLHDYGAQSRTVLVAPSQKELGFREERVFIWRPGLTRDYVAAVVGGGGENDALVAWDLRVSPPTWRRIALEHRPFDLAAARRANRVVVRTLGGVRIVSIEQGRERTLAGAPEATAHDTEAVAISDDGRRVALLRKVDHLSRAELSLWDADSGERLWAVTRPVDQDGGVRSRLRFSADGRVLIAANSTGRVVAVHTVRGRFLGELGRARPRHAADALFLQGDLLAVITERQAPLMTEFEGLGREANDERLAIWSLRDGRRVHSQPISRQHIARTSGGALAVVHCLVTEESRSYIDAYQRIDVFRGAEPPKGPPVPATPDNWAQPGRSYRIEFRPSDRLDVARHRVVELGDERGEDAFSIDIFTGEKIALNESLPSYETPFYDDTPYWRPPSIVHGPGLGWSIQREPSDYAPRARFGRPSPSAAIAPDGSRAVYGYDAIALRVLPSGKSVWSVPVPKGWRSPVYDLDGDDVFAGGENGELALLRAGKTVMRAASAGGDITLIHAERDGDRLLTSSRDGALRIWDRASGRLRATLVEFDDGEAIAFTPQGAYAGPREVAERVAWVFDDPVEAFGFEQFEHAYRDPETVGRRLAGDDVDASAVARPPRVELVGEPTVSGASARVRLRARSPLVVERVRAFVEARPVADSELCATDGEHELAVPLLPGANRVAIYGFDVDGRSSNPILLDLRATEGARSDLWLVAVGISQYPRLPARFQLAYADDDARAIAAALRGQVGKSRRYRALHEVVLENEGADVRAITKALQRLAKMRPDDVAVVFLAGHGVKPSPAEDMVFITGEVEAGARGIKPASIREQGVGWTTIARTLSKARGRVVVLLDACHSGHLSQELMVRNDDLAGRLAGDGRAGVVVFAAAKGRQFSYEPTGTRGLELSAEQEKLVVSDAPHGFFTGALLKALTDPGADLDADGTLQLSELVVQVTRRVSKATDGRQTPWVARREAFSDFGIASFAER